jgi:hypothetical protein
MGLFLRQEDTRSELQSKIATELREKLKERADVQSEKPEPAFLENQHQTRPAGMILIVLGLLLAIALIFFVLKMSGIL